MNCFVQHVVADGTDQSKAFVRVRKIKMKDEPMTEMEATLKERGDRYGDFTEHAAIAQDILDVYMSTCGWDNLSPDKRQAFRMFADKAARILNGDPEYKDNWHDIAGYAKLAEDRCKTIP